jgi:hypothetical protein
MWIERRQLSGTICSILRQWSESPKRSIQKMGYHFSLKGLARFPHTIGSRTLWLASL